MNKNAEIITILCSHLCLADDIKPLEPSQWHALEERLRTCKLQIADLADFAEQDFEAKLGYSPEEAARLMRLLDRSGSLCFELARYEDMGINIITCADESYPKQLKRKLEKKYPPMFYSVGDPALLESEAVGYVGSRDVSQDDIDFTKKTVATTAALGYAVVSGGARGIDSVAATAAMAEGVPAIEFLSDSLLRKMRNATLMREIRDGHVLLMSVAVPTAGFNVGIAMMRNHYIYAQSVATVVVRSDLNKGGTWSGAKDNLKQKYCPLFCRDCDYPGNKALIEMSAIPIDENWDGDISAKTQEETSEAQQISMFDLGLSN